MKWHVLVELFVQVGQAEREWLMRAALNRLRDSVNESINS